MPVLNAIPLSPDRTEDVASLQALLDDSTYDSILIEDKASALPAAQQLFRELPPGKVLGDKLVIGIYDGAQLAGCADLIRGFPEARIAYLGLLFFKSSAQCQGFGPWALDVIDAICATWGCAELRLAVVDTNLRGLAFWQREGFTELYRKPTLRGAVIVMKRANKCLQTAASDAHT